MKHSCVVSALRAFALASLYTAHAATQQTSPTIPTVPGIVSNGRAQPGSPVDGNRSLRLTLSLPLRNQASLPALLQQIYDPTGPGYRQYLSADQFTTQFGPTQADYDLVVAWSRSKGLNVAATTANRRLVNVTGLVSTIETAFRTTLRSYSDPVTGRTFFAPDQEPVLDLAVPLHAVIGLTNVSPPVPQYKKAAARKISPEITGSGPGNTYLPSDMRAAYSGTGL